MNKALEQKLIGPMEESHTKEQSPQAVLWKVLWARRSKIAAKWARTRAWAGWWFFWEYLRIYCAKITAGGAATWPRGWRARPTPLGMPPASWAHGGPPPLIPTHFFFLCLTQTRKTKHEFQPPLLWFLISLLKAPFAKLLGEIVPCFVTPPLVQLVFVLVLYSLQICAA